jgi:hypothetical protein
MSNLLDFGNTRDNLIHNIPNNFIYLVIFIVVMYTSTILLKTRTSHMIALIVSYYIVSSLDQKSRMELSNFNKEIDSKYNVIGKPKNFYLDANLILLYYSIYKWRNLNPNNYDESVKACNNVLQIQLDSDKGLIRCVDNYEIALEQSKLALNYIHGFVYNIDNPILVKKLKDVLKRLQQLLARHLFVIRNNCQQIENNKSSIDVNSRFIQDSDGPKAYDEYVSNFDLY